MRIQNGTRAVTIVRAEFGIEDFGSNKIQKRRGRVFTASDYALAITTVSLYMCNIIGLQSEYNATSAIS